MVDPDKPSAKISDTQPGKSGTGAAQASDPWANFKSDLMALEQAARDELASRDPNEQDAEQPQASARLYGDDDTNEKQSEDDTSFGNRSIII